MIIYQGKTHDFQLLVKRKRDNKIQNLTGYKLRYTIKKSNSDKDTSIIFTKDAEIPEPTSGIGSFEFDIEDTSALPVDNFWFDIQITDDLNFSKVIVPPTRVSIKLPTRRGL